MARRPWPGPLSRTIVPVCAIPCPVLQLARRSRLPPFARVGPCRRRPLSSLSLSPPLAEGLVGDREDVPNGGPAPELTWEAGDHSPLEEQSLAEAAELLHPLELRRAGEDPGEQLHGESLDAGQHAVLLLVPDDLAAQVQEDFGDVDLHRADIVAGATER